MKEITKMTNKPHLAAALTCAVLMYVILSICEPILSFPLRQFSSHFSYGLLQFFINDIDLNGTIISSHGINFDVVPACSGSSTLKYILSFGTVLCVMSKKNSLRNLFFSFVSLIFLALCFNSLRISSLIILGIINSAPVEGAMHSLIGLIWFSISMLSIHAFLKLSLSKVSHLPPRKKMLFKEAFIAFVYLMIFYPFLADTVLAWMDSPLDKFSWIFFLESLYMFKLISSKIEVKSTNAKIDKGCFWGVQIMIIIALFFDLNALWFIAFSMLLATYLIQLKGLAHSYLFLPAFVVLFCAFPVSSYLISTYVPSSYLQTNPIITKLLITTLMVIIYLSSKFDRPRTKNHDFCRIKHSYCLLMIYAISSLMLHSKESTKASNYPSYIIGPWTGAKQTMPAYLINFFENGEVICREYKSAENSIQLMVSMHNNERHSMHSPEYCLKGADWEIISSQNHIINSKYSVRIVSAQKDNIINHYAYWFEQDGEYYTNMVEVLREDISLRLRGQPRNWALTRIKAKDKKQMFNFLNYLINESTIQITKQSKINNKMETSQNES
jgi:EpsI family protein